MLPLNRDSKELRDSTLDDAGGGGGGSRYSDMRPPEESGLVDTSLSTDIIIEFFLRGGNDGRTGGSLGGRPWPKLLSFCLPVLGEIMTGVSGVTMLGNWLGSRLLGRP